MGDPTFYERVILGIFEIWIENKGVSDGSALILAY